MESTATIIIKRDRSEVFDYVSDPTNMNQWVEGVSDLRLTSTGSFGEGTTFESKYTYGAGTYDIRYDVTVFDPPRSFGIKSEEGPFAFQGCLVLEIDDAGTMVSNTLKVGADGVFTKVMFTLFGPLVRRSMRKQLAKELELLRTELEAS